MLFRARHDLLAPAVIAGFIFSFGAIGSLLGTAIVSRLHRALGWQACFLTAFPVLMPGAV